MPGDVQVARLRISYIAGRIHDDLQEIGNSVVFARLLTNAQPVRGLQISLPFGEGLPVETKFWSNITEGKALSRPLSGEKLLRAGVPLRYRGGLATVAGTAGVEVPVLEAHLHSFGVAVMATVDLTWPTPVPLGKEVIDRVKEIGDMRVVITVGRQETETTLAQAASVAAAGLVGLLTDDGQGNEWDLLPHRLATVISGDIAGSLDAMPPARSPLHLALHWLSADEDVLGVPEPEKAFVAQWNGAGYGWPASSLVYMLQSGTSMLSAEAWAPKRDAGQPSTSGCHRHLLLELAYIAALSGLVCAAQEDASGDFPDLAMTAAKHLGRLYGPAGRYAAWGLIPRALMIRTGVSAYIGHLLGTGLIVNEDYQVADYG